MELEHTFTVPVPVDQAWDVLLDVERVAPCMPGASLDSVDGDQIHGRIKVKVGPINMVYAGTARFVERDVQARVVRLDASGKETKGAGTASASIRSVLEDHGDETHVTVLTTLNVTGKPAQFGRGVMNEVSGKLLTMFAANLAKALAQQEEAAAVTGEAEPGAADQAILGADAPLDALKLPTRVAATLQRDGITTVGQLAAKTDDELLALDGIGPASLDEIRAKLAEHRLGTAPAPATSPAATTAAAGAAAATGAGVGATAGGAVSTGATAARTPAEAPAAAPHPHPATAREAAHQLEDDAINLFKVAGMPILKRALPVLVGLTAVLLIGLRKKLRRRR